jgi:DNA ligase-associated metallophosphoesterase
MSLVLDFEPARVIFLGDLFHSHYNEEWEGLCELMQGFQHIQFELVKGNHDILAEELYLSSGLILHEEPLLLDGFALSHHPLDSWSDTHYNLAGHVHPGVWLQGRGHQRLRLPCFFFGAHQGLLPAFGQFTGLGIVQTGQGDRVFVIAEDSVQEVA